MILRTHKNPVKISRKEFLNKAFELAPALLKREDGTFYHLYPKFSYDLKSQLKQAFPDLSGQHYHHLMSLLFSMTTKRIAYLESAQKADKLYDLTGKEYVVTPVEFLKWRTDRAIELQKVKIESNKMHKIYNWRAFFYCLSSWVAQSDVRNFKNKDMFDKSVAIYKFISMILVNKKKVQLKPEMFQYSLLDIYMKKLDPANKRENELLSALKLYKENVSLEEHKQGTRLLIEGMKSFLSSTFELPQIPKTKTRDAKTVYNSNKKRSSPRRNYQVNNDSAEKKGHHHHSTDKYKKEGSAKWNYQNVHAKSEWGQRDKLANRNYNTQTYGNVNGNSNRYQESAERNINEIGYDANKGTYIRQLEYQQKKQVVIYVKKGNGKKKLKKLSLKSKSK